MGVRTKLPRVSGPPPDKESKRKYVRARVPLLVQYRYDQLEEFQAEYARDFSAGGLFLVTSDPRPKGTILFLQFSSKDGLKLVEVQGKVVYVSAPGDPAREAGMGVEFMEVDPRLHELLMELSGNRGLFQSLQSPGRTRDPSR